MADGSFDFSSAVTSFHSKALSTDKDGIPTLRPNFDLCQYLLFLCSTLPPASNWMSLIGLDSQAVHSISMARVSHKLNRRCTTFANVRSVQEIVRPMPMLQPRPQRIALSVGCSRPDFENKTNENQATEFAT